jgi:L-seryl-tRNA(Ser) seleniumtransferase
MITSFLDAHAEASIFQRLGIPYVVNAAGIYTDLGGSILSPAIWQALTELNTRYVDMVELLDRCGAMVAELTGTQAARITPGASAALALSAAACIAGDHPPHWEKLPDTAGMKPRILIQRPQYLAYKYLTPVRLAGAQIVAVGSDGATSEAELEAAIDERTAAILIPAHLDSLRGVAPMEAVAAIARRHGIRLIVDAAYQVYPTTLLRSFAERGADLTCVSAKYYGGPNAGGFVAGTREMIDIVTGLDFTRYESQPIRAFGRAFKMGRTEIAATALALEAWCEADHDARMAREAQLADHIARRLSAAGARVALKGFTLDEDVVDTPVNAVEITPPPGVVPADLARRLFDGSPRIKSVDMGDTLLLVTETLRDGEEALVAERLVECLAEAP